MDTRRGQVDNKAGNSKKNGGKSKNSNFSNNFLHILEREGEKKPVKQSGGGI